MVTPFSRSRSMGVEHLLGGITVGDRTGGVQQTIRQRGFAVVDMRDNTKIADIFVIHFFQRENLI